ncbi:MAG: DUF433 domain-containing protein [Gemmatimonadales bacterium]
MRERDLKLLGVGIYSQAEVARLLSLSPGRVRSWVRGYRYAWGPKERRRRGEQPAVIKTDIPTIDGSFAVSFLELVELFVVKQFRDNGIPLQTVRVAWNHAAQAFDTLHPFANRRVFTDDGRVFMALRDDDLAPDVLEVSSRHMPFQIVAGPIFRHSFEEIEFDEHTELARRWWPRGRHTPIVLDPAIAFGAPVVRGTRVPTTIIARYAEARPIKVVADAFELPSGQVKAAVTFESQLACAA